MASTMPCLLWLNSLLINALNLKKKKKKKVILIYPLILYRLWTLLIIMKKVHINLLICTPLTLAPSLWFFERANDECKVYFIIFFIFYLSILHNLFTIWLVAIGKLIWKEYEFNESSSSYHNTIHLMTYPTYKAKSTINARSTTNWILNHWCTSSGRLAMASHYRFTVVET